ncbi:DUF418 domain-containing protein [Bacillus sp. A116_S68]|nr:DUF418 domain-containing protein [Bacillus sp. A116_S68]
MMNHSDKYSKPIAVHERVDELDMIRGFALLGILVANMPFFGSSFVYSILANDRLWTEGYHIFAEGFIHFFATSKFFTMFSFLFGLGFVIFLERAAEKTKHPRRLFLRRLFFLLIFGLIHAFGIWYGDILVLYAITGVLLLLFHKAKPKTVIIWAFCLIGLPALLFTFLAFLMYVARDMIPADIEGISYGTELAEQAFAAYSSGSVSEIFAQRAFDYRFMFSSNIFMLPIVLGMFLFGVYIAKTKKHTNISEHLSFYQKVWVWSLIIGFPVNILFVYSYFSQGPDNMAASLAYTASTMVSGPALCFFYMTTIVLLVQKGWGKLFVPLKAVGRMALSNYLCQSIVCTLIFYNYGLGLFGEVGPLIWLFIAIILFAGQIILSHMWLKRFRFGPAEWAWRSLTYGRIQPLKMRSK